MTDRWSVYGRSLSFPLRVGGDGRLVWSQGEDNIRESIAVLLKTEPGERIGLPQFGGGLERFLFEPNTPATHARIEATILAALARWEGRVQAESVVVEVHPELPDHALATLSYRLVATGNRERLAVAVQTGSGG